MSDSPISFNNIPSNLVGPIFTFEVNSGGQYEAIDRFIIIGHKTAAGSMALNQAIPVASQNQVDAYAGAGSHLREMYRIAAQNAPATPFWIMAIDDASLTAAVWSLTIGALPSGAGVGVFELCGEKIQIGISATDTPTTVAAAVAAAINAYWNPLTGAMLPVTATSALAVVTITARNKGAIFNETDVYVDPLIQGNIFAATGVWTLTQTTPGAGTPTGVAAALAALGDDPADFVVCPWSDTTSLGSYTAWGSDVSGRWAWSRQAYGHVWCADVGAFSALTTLGLTLNDRHTTVIGCIAPGAAGTPHSSYLWAAGFAARVSPWLMDCTTGNVSRNQTGLVVQGLKPPRDRSVWPNYSGRNTLVSSGISTWKVGADGSVQVDKIVTTYRTGSSGQPDAVFQDIQAVYQVSGGLSFIRAGLATQFGQKAIAPSNPGNLGAIVTPADIKGGFISLYSQLCDRGVYADKETYAKLLSVKQNADNKRRVDAFCPLERVNPLDVLAANAVVYQKFPQAA
jgi:phage tail sheath gpL-like